MKQQLQFQQCIKLARQLQRNYSYNYWSSNTALSRAMKLEDNPTVAIKYTRKLTTGLIIDMLVSFYF